MKKPELSQEGLKLIACVSMLLDHIGAVTVTSCFETATGADKGALLDLYEALRLIGRLAFPIYCFLLVEGAFYTRSPKKYALRLLIGALLAELPFDLAIYGGFTWAHQSAMVTLLLGFCGLEVMKRCPTVWWKLLAAVPFVILGDLVRVDYFGEGIMLVFLFALTRDMPHKRLAQFLGMWFIFSPGHRMLLNWLGGFSVTLQEWAALALIPIGFYSGKKETSSKWVQWGFYLFYPVHLTALYLIGRL